MRPRIEKLVDVKELARLAGAHQRTMQRRVAAWRKEPAQDFIERIGGKDWVNLSRLRRAKPGLFGVAFATAEDLECVVDRVVRLEEWRSDSNMRQNALAAAIRRLRPAQH